MSKLDQGTSLPSDDTLEQLFKHAAPRPTPSQADQAAVKRAVRAEWQDLTRKRQVRQRVLQYAIAATVLIGVFALFSVIRTPVVGVVQVAAIQKSFGSVYLLGEESELRETRDLATVYSGQTVVTGKETGIALAWDNGGSLRMDENTRVEFAAKDSIHLKYGQIYFDSEPSSLIADIAAERVDDFLVVTDFGEVAHVGTQFIASVRDDELTVSVREGEVTVSGAYHDHVAKTGQRVTLTGRQQPTVLNIGRSGDTWDWVSRTSPAVDVEGRSFHDLLEWVSRETGMAFRYEGRAEQIARQEAILRGTIDKEPLEALRLWSRASKLQSHVAEGVIHVGEIQ